MEKRIKWSEDELQLLDQLRPLEIAALLPHRSVPAIEYMIWHRQRRAWLWDQTVSRAVNTLEHCAVQGESIYRMIRYGENLSEPKVRAGGGAAAGVRFSQKTGEQRSSRRPLPRMHTARCKEEVATEAPIAVPSA